MLRHHCFLISSEKLSHKTTAQRQRSMMHFSPKLRRRSETSLSSSDTLPSMKRLLRHRKSWVKEGDLNGRLAEESASWRAGEFLLSTPELFCIHSYTTLLSNFLQITFSEHLLLKRHGGQIRRSTQVTVLLT